MRISRRTVTRASRIMLPGSGLFSVVLGLTWSFQDPSRTNPSLQALHNVWPVSATGIIFLVLGIAVGGSLLTHRREAAAISLACGFIAYLALGAIFLGPLHLHWSWGWPFMQIQNPTASLSIPYWPWYVALAHFASFVSVMSDEYTDAQGINRRAPQT